MNGLLVAPRDPGAMAAALERAIVDPALRARLAAAGRRVVTTEFSFEDGVGRIAARLTAPSVAAAKPDPAGVRGLCEPAS